MIPRGNPQRDDAAAPAEALGRPDPAQAARSHHRSTSAHRENTAGQAEENTEVSRLLRTLADESMGPLAGVRHLVERAAQHLDALPQPCGAANGHHLEWIARRVHAIQEDLLGIAHTITGPPAPSRRTAAAPPPDVPSAPAPADHRPVR